MARGGKRYGVAITCFRVLGLKRMDDIDESSNLASGLFTKSSSENGTEIAVCERNLEKV
jgi:hypothetical protein